MWPRSFLRSTHIPCTTNIIIDGYLVAHYTYIHIYIYTCIYIYILVYTCKNLYQMWFYLWTHFWVFHLTQHWSFHKQLVFGGIFGMNQNAQSRHQFVNGLIQTCLWNKWLRAGYTYINGKQGEKYSCSTQWKEILFVKGCTRINHFVYCMKR